MMLKEAKCGVASTGRVPCEWSGFKWSGCGVPNQEVAEALAVSILTKQVLPRAGCFT